MNSTASLVIKILVAIVAIYIGWYVLGFLFTGLVTLLGVVIKLAIAAAVVGGIYYAITRLTGGSRALPGGGRKPLP